MRRIYIKKEATNMKNLSKNQKFISLFFQVVSAFILGMASMAKFTHKPMAVEVFESLGIPETMLIIATVEAIAAIYFCHLGHNTARF